MPYVAVRPDTLCAWSGPSLLVVNNRGECGEDQRLTGYYFREARFLRTLRLRINDQPPAIESWRVAHGHKRRLEC